MSVRSLNPAVQTDADNNGDLLSQQYWCFIGDGLCVSSERSGSLVNVHYLINLSKTFVFTKFILIQGKSSLSVTNILSRVSQFWECAHYQIIILSMKTEPLLHVSAITYYHRQGAPVHNKKSIHYKHSFVSCKWYITQRQYVITTPMCSVGSVVVVFVVFGTTAPSGPWPPLPRGF
jgi:hypothetical protein